MFKVEDKWCFFALLGYLYLGRKGCFFCLLLQRHWFCFSSAHGLAVSQAQNGEIWGRRDHSQQSLSLGAPVLHRTKGCSADPHPYLSSSAPSFLPAPSYTK